MTAVAAAIGAGSAPSTRRGRRWWPVAFLALCVALTGCDLRLLVPDGPGPLRYRDEVFGEVTVTRDVPYGQAVDQTGATVTLLLDLYEPAGDTVTARPAIIWVHGGAFRFGSKTSPELVDQANVFARKGYVNASISYRLSPTGCLGGAPLPACMEAMQMAQHDAQAAVRYLRAHATSLRIDPTRIAIAGTSAGAVTALHVAWGADDPGDSGNPGYPSHVRAAVSLSGAKILGRAERGEPPVLLFHGTADTVVPYAWAQITARDALAAGVHAELTAWEGAGHVPYVAHRAEILTQTSNFLYWTLDAPHAAR